MNIGYREFELLHVKVLTKNKTWVWVWVFNFFSSFLFQLNCT